MVTKHYPLNGDESKQTPGSSEEQGSLVCCSPWGHKESDMSQQLNSDKCDKYHVRQYKAFLILPTNNSSITNPF